MPFDLNLGDLGEKAGTLGGTVLQWSLIVVAGIVIIAIFGIIAWWAMRRKKWNLIIEIKMPRSNGELILRERARGYYDSKAGIVDIKRKKLRAVGMRPFDVKKYLQGSKYLEVIQISPTEYIPVLPKSYTTVRTKEQVPIKGKDKEFKTEYVAHAILDIETDFEKRKTWKNYMERAAKDRFTIIGFLDKHWRAIEISIILFVVFLGMSILWMRMPSICG